MTKYLQMLLDKKLVIFASILDACFRLRFFENHNSTLEHSGTSASQFPTMFKEEARNYSEGPTPAPHNTKNEASGLFDKMYPAAVPVGRTLENEIIPSFCKPTKPK
ncbi:hypothetical protein O181_002287 [Austropuccinia psidii MF-1]|uniref:Uncharacterized protein n=1 Tax=Austropuccinia psidii MF-1 TaxID=1389203 RepID=A0A9Q3BCI7_9BASI|nr:hypothetical protein [Austropuccinia psidii MF-1]